jgi:hypothetical protein
MVTPPASYPYHNNLVLLAKAANHPERRGSVPHLSPYPATPTQDQRMSPMPTLTAAFANVRPRSRPC